MQSNVNLTSQNAPVLHGDNHDQLSNTYVIRRTVDAVSTKEHCDCPSKSVLDGRCPTYGRTPLHPAVLDGHEEMAKELLDHGLASAADYKGQTALHFAGQRHSPDSDGRTPLRLSHHEQTIHHPSPSFKTSLPYDTLKPQGPASICEEGGNATVSLYLPDQRFVLKGSEVWVDGKCLSRRLSPLSVASIMREDAVYKRLGSHPLILNYDGKVLVNGNVYSLKIERALGCLRKFVLNCPAPSEETRLAMAVQAVASISYTHSKNVIHADFSTRNLFVFDNWQLKLGDFGGSRIDNQAALAAEEALYQLPRYGRAWRDLDETKRELFALGCGLYEIITWKTLYAELRAQQAVVKHNKGEFPDTRGLLASNIICKCWHEEYNAAVDVERDLRKELADIKRHM